MNLIGIQYRAAKLLVHDLRAHGSPLLAKLHWLPIDQRIVFKVLLYVFKSINDLAPSYIADLIEPYHSNRRGLRSANDSTRLHVPRSRNTFGDKCFTHCASTIWNKLPLELRNTESLTLFKRKLKTHLFPK